MAKAIEWDVSFQNALNQDQSGRMVDVHDDATVSGSAAGAVTAAVTATAVTATATATATAKAPVFSQAELDDCTPEECDGGSGSIG